MCLNEGLNRVHECDVSDLEPGGQYRTPDGQTILVTEQSLFDGPGNAVQTVNIRTGRIGQVDGATKLGHDRAGRLYASRYLNPPTDEPNTTTMGDV